MFKETVKHLSKIRNVVLCGNYIISRLHRIDNEGQRHTRFGVFIQ